ncbi:hypothetical protein [Streptomyces gilvosporeus]|uniref:hypothetical protein n=1 Tax=Streptomyces gilvosporeus TaxID=553510 RepID=UPI00131EB2EE|nr:hypothetical protein [Streptomyces gilvosporeus]
MKRLAVLTTAVATSALIILGAGTANADGPGSGSAQIGTVPITEALQKVLSGSILLN